MQQNMVFKDWLAGRKISEAVQEEFNLSFEDNITIPIYDIDGEFIFNKYRRSPLSEEKPKYWYDKGGKVLLYGLHKAKDSKTILITEGEMDCLVAWSHNIPAVSSTGGAMSFQPEWAEYFEDKEVIICFDNDPAGAEGMVKVLNIIPHAKVLLLPDSANMKDISDYVSRGGDLHTLLQTAKHYSDVHDVQADRQTRLATWKSIHFHVAYLKDKETKFKAQMRADRKQEYDDEFKNAKAYPMTNLLKLNNSHKCCCPFHNEKTPSFQYYPDTNTGYCFGCGKVADSVEVYKHMHNCDFKTAVKELNKL